MISVLSNISSKYISFVTKNPFQMTEEIDSHEKMIKKIHENIISVKKFIFIFSKTTPLKPLKKII